jgi:hypothetical protein
MAKPVSYTLNALKLRAFFDDTLYGIVGRRLFTSVVTDNALRDAITRARRSRGYTGVVSKRVARNAAAARKALHN